MGNQHHQKKVVTVKNKYETITTLESVGVVLAPIPHTPQGGCPGPPGLSSQHAVGILLRLCHSCCLLIPTHPLLLILTSPVGCLS